MDSSIEITGRWKDGLVTVKDTNTNLNGIVNRDYAIVIPLIYVRIGRFNEGLVWAIDQTDKGGYLDIQGNVAIPFIYDDVSYFHEGLARVCYKHKVSYIDKEGRPINPFMYAGAEIQFYDGTTIVQNANLEKGQIDRYGFICAYRS